MTSSNIKLVYIMSPSYSGSTLLTTLIAQRTDIATIGELKANNIENIDSYTCSCGTRILECQFWANLQNQMKQQGAILELNDFKTRFRSNLTLADRVLRPNVKGRFLETVRSAALTAIPSCKSELERALKQNENVITSCCQLKGTKTFLDGSKDPLRVLLFLNHAKYDLKVIFLTRDGRGTANSDIKYNKLSMEQAAISWKNKIQEMERVADYLSPQQTLRLRYEDLCREPDAKLEEIFQFAGLPRRSEDDLNFDLHILGNNNMRLVNTSEVKLDEKWKITLSKEDILQFESIAGTLNQQLGYEAYQ